MIECGETHFLRLTNLFPGGRVLFATQSDCSAAALSSVVVLVAAASNDGEHDRRKGKPDDTDDVQHGTDERKNTQYQKRHLVAAA